MSVTDSHASREKGRPEKRPDGSRRDFLKTAGALPVGAIAAQFGATAAAKTPFLTRRGNRLFFDGARYRAVGANGVDLFVSHLGVRVAYGGDQTPEHAREALVAAGKHAIPFLRIMGSGFWPADMKTYFDRSETYWKRFDEFVALAKNNNVKLLVTLFWNYWMWPDLTKEPCSAIFRRDSRARQAMEKYLREIVGRYKDEPTILCWEIGNEMNLGADLDMAHWPKNGIAPRLGTPEKRAAADSFSTAELIRFTREIAARIKQIDSNHLVTTGHALPRFSSRALREGFPEVRWRPSDTIEDYLDTLEMLHPDPVDIISIHIYGNRPDDAERIPWDGKDWIDILGLVKKRTDRMAKPLCIGEFSDMRTLSEDPSSPFSVELMAKMVEWDIPLAAIWVWYRTADPHNMADGVAEPMIQRIGQANQVLGG